MNVSISPASSAKPTPAPYLTGVRETDKRINEIMQKYFKENVLHRYLSGSDGCELSLSYSVGMNFSLFYPNRGLAKEFFREVNEVLVKCDFDIDVIDPTLDEIKKINFTCTSFSPQDTAAEPQTKKNKNELSIPDQEFSKSLHELLLVKTFGQVYESLVKYIGYDPLDARQATDHFKQYTQKKKYSDLFSYLHSTMWGRLENSLPNEYQIFVSAPNTFQIRKEDFTSFDDMNDVELSKIAHSIIDACFSLKTQFDLNNEEFRKKLESF